MAYDLGLGDDDINRGSSQTGVCHGERATPNARVGHLRACDKCNETCRREEAKEEGEGRSEGRGMKREEGKAGPAEIGWKTLPNSHARPQIPRRHKSRPLQTMVRQFKHHEQKLLKKVDFLNVCPLLFSQSHC